MATKYSEVPTGDAAKKENGKSAPSPGAKPEDDSGVICLKPKMTLLNGITVIVGSIIGSGIFVSPKGVLTNTGSVGLSLFVWVSCGVFSMIGAYCYAELGCMITKTGADYAYIMESFGPFVAFLRLWVECMIVRPCSQAIVALTFSFYVLRPIFPDCEPPDDAVRYLACICIGCMITKTGADYAYIMESFGPFVAFLRLWVECIVIRPCMTAIVALTFAFYVLRPFYPDCEPPGEAVRLLAALCPCLLTFVNCWDVKWATRVQDFFTYGKLIALATIIGTGMYQLSKGHTEHFTFENSETDVTKIALSFYSGLFAYNGWNYLNFVIEELKDPHRNLPKAIFISCILVTVVYTLTIIAFHSTLSVAEVLGAEAVAVTFADRLYGKMAWIVPVFVAMSTFGGVNGILFTSSRLFYAGAEHNQMPQILSMIQISHLTPTPAVIFMCILSLLYLASKDIYALINYVGFATWLAIGLAVVCVPYLRYTQPDLPRPIKVHLFFPYIYILATIFITVVPMYADPIGTGFGCLIIATGVPVYFLFIGWKNKPLRVQRFISSFTALLQKLMVVVPSEKASSL